jgi:hypothetical protein
VIRSLSLFWEGAELKYHRLACARKNSGHFTTNKQSILPANEIIEGPWLATADFESPLEFRTAVEGVEG